MDVYVFSEELEVIGHTDVMKSGIWTEKFSDVGTFEFWAPLDPLHTELLQEGRIVYMLEHKSAGIIELIEKDNNDTGATIHVAGRHLKSYLDRRVVYPTFNGSGKPSTIARNLVSQNCISPSDKKRVIPNLTLDDTDPEYGESTSVQKTGGSVMDAETEFLASNSLGSEVILNTKDKKMVYTIHQGVNRSIDQDSVDPVLLSTDMDAILKSSYECDSSEFRNIAYVAGEGEGSARKLITVGDESLSGLARRELYVDARDLQSTTTEESGSETTMTDSEYENLLKTRGEEKLTDYKRIESFETTIRTDEFSGYLFGRDFYLGDTITVYDTVLKIKSDVQVVAVEYTYKSSGDDITLTLGYPRLSVMEKLRRDTK